MKIRETIMRIIKKLVLSLSYFKVRTRLIFFFLLISLLPLIIVGFYSYDNSRKTVEEKVGFYSRELVKQAVVNIDSRIREIEDTAVLIYSNINVMNILAKTEEDYGGDRYLRFQEQQTVSDALSPVIYSSNVVDGLAVYKPDESDFYLEAPRDLRNYFEESFKNSELYQRVVDTEKAIWVAGINEDDQNIYMMKRLTSVRTNQLIGVLVFALNRSFVENIYDVIYLGEDSMLSFLNQDNHIIFTDNEELMGTTVAANLADRFTDEETGYFTEKEYLVSYGTCRNGWKIYASIPMISLMDDIYTVGFNTFFIGLICMVVAVLLALVLASSISIPTNDLMGLMEKVEKGNLTVSSNLKGRDELSALANSFNIMITRIKDLLMKTSDTSKQVEKNADYVNRFAEQTATSVQQVSSTIEHIAQGANEQANQAQDSVQLMDELAKRIENISTNIKSLNEATELVRETSSQASKLVENLNQKTSETALVTEKIKEDTEKLYDKTGEIKKIIAVIEDISEQTSLLSLNASIEAARAGQAGRGFSVVADEIRNMSEESVKATSMVKDIVKTIDNATRNTVEEVDKAQPLYKEQQGSVQETANAFEEIMGVINNIFDDISKTSGAIKEIDSFKVRVMKDIENMANIAQESAATTEEVSAESEEQSSLVEQFVALASNLKNAVDELNKVMESFKI